MAAPDIKLPEFGALYPPCVICNGKGSGIHYGVYTCSACKSFFKRWLMRPTTLICKKGNACNVLDTAYKSCPACRYKKCVEKGMKLQAARHGRLSSAFKTKLISDVKCLELQSKIKENGKHATLTEHEKTMDDIVNRLTETRLQCVPNSCALLETMLDNEKKFLEEKAIEREIFGERNLLERTDAKKIYEETGIDVDGRKKIIQSVIPTVNQSISDVLELIKLIPGFDQLTKKDQSKLFKYAYPFMNIFLFNHNHNLSDGVSSNYYSAGHVYTFEELMFFINNHQEVMDMVYATNKRIQDMELTIEETVIASVLIICTMADIGLNELSQKLLMSSADFMAEILHREINKNHDPSDQIFSKIISFICQIPEQQNFMPSMMMNFYEDCKSEGLPNGAGEDYFTGILNE